MVDKKFQRFDEETEEDYKFRICGMRKENRLTWQEICDIINEELDLNYTESKYRKEYAAYCKGYEDRDKEEEISPEISELINAKIELKKERVKLSDERVQTNAYIRQIAREETIKEIAIQTAKEMSSKKILEASGESPKIGVNDAILELSDWHYGIEIDNYWNKYNPDVAKERVSTLLREVIAKCKANNVRDIYVANLADLICGRIHLGLRLESRFDVITQTMQVSEILAEFLNELANHFNVHYYDCLDNHSRLEPNKKDAMDLESLARIIPWYLKERLGNRIEINDNKFDEGIISFDCHGYNIIGCHGDHDKPNMVVDNMTLMTHKHYDLVLTAHLHHFSADEKNETLVVSNGSLMGTDTYAKNLRLSSKASQNLIIVSDKSVCEALYRIQLN